MGVQKSTPRLRRGTPPSRRVHPVLRHHRCPRVLSGVPTRPPGWLGLPPGAAPRPQPSALCAARLRHRHAEIPEVPPRQPPGHAAARPSPPPSALSARWAFPSTGRIPSSLGRPGDKTFLARPANSAPHPGSSRTRQKNQEKTYPNCNAKV